VPEGVRRRDRAKPWEAYVHDPATGQKVFRSFTRLQDAQRWRRDAQRQIDSGRSVVERRTQTFGEAAADLLAGMETGAIRARGGGRFRASVVRKYRHLLTRYTLPRFADRRLSQITRRDLVDLIEELHGLGLAPSTIRNALDPIRVIFRRAIIRGDVEVPPWAGLELPYGEARPRDQVADGAEAALLVEALTRAAARCGRPRSMAGHASIAITLDRYGQLLPGAEEEAMQRVADYLARAPLGRHLASAPQVSSASASGPAPNVDDDILTGKEGSVGLHGPSG
jgi:hypothetical protein